MNSRLREISPGHFTSTECSVGKENIVSKYQNYPIKISEQKVYNLASSSTLQCWNRGHFINLPPYYKTLTVACVST